MLRSYLRVISVICQGCLEEFSTYPSRIKVGKKFCSQSCRRTFWAATPERFWTYVDKTETCWLWTGSHTPDGYGQYEFSGTGISILAHRYTYEETYGPIPNGLIIRHKCDTPPCVRPSHLIPGNHKDNTQDALLRCRSAIGNRVGSSKLIDKDVQLIRLLSEDGWTNTSIARVVHVTAHQVGRVVLRRNWIHVEEV